MKLKKTYLILFLLSGINLFSQNTNKDILPMGTYQFVFKDRGSEVSYSLSENEKVYLNSLRDEDEIKMISLSETITIKLLPKSSVDKSDFKPLEHVCYLNEVPSSDSKNGKLPKSIN